VENESEWPELHELVTRANEPNEANLIKSACEKSSRQLKASESQCIHSQHEQCWQRVVSEHPQRKTYNRPPKYQRSMRAQADGAVLSIRACARASRRRDARRTPSCHPLRRRVHRRGSRTPRTRDRCAPRACAPARRRRGTTRTPSCRPTLVFGVVWPRKRADLHLACTRLTWSIIALRFAALRGTHARALR